METWLPILTAMAGVLLTAAGFLLAGWQHTKESLEQRVERAVKGQVGDRFMDFLDVGERTAREMAELTQEAKSQSEKMISDAEEQLDRLKRGQDVLHQLEDLLNRAERVIPNLDVLSAAVPAAMLRELEGPHVEPPQVIAILETLLAAPGVTSKQLEEGGDRARELLEDLPLSRKLYKAALQANPSNVSARAELLGIDLLESDEARAEVAREELKELALAQPTERTPLIKLLNDYVRRDRYDDMEALIRDQLKKFPDEPLLWRNLAVALSSLNRPASEVGAAYERAIELSSHPDRVGDLVNTAKSFVSWLAYQGQPERANEVLHMALREMPTEDELYLASYRLAMAQKDVARAKRSLRLMARHGGQREAWIATRLEAGLDGLEYLETGDESKFPAPSTVEPDALRALLAELDHRDIPPTASSL